MAINRQEEYTSIGIKQAIPLSRHNNPQYSIGVDVGSGATFTVQGTLSKINRAGVVPIWFDIPALTGILVDTNDKIVNTPLEAVRINITAITDNVIFQVMQNT